MPRQALRNRHAFGCQNLFQNVLHAVVEIVQESRDSSKLQVGKLRERA